jgi:hypothetical protein
MSNDDLHSSRIIPVEALTKSHAVYAQTVHVITIISAVMALFMPILILAFSNANILNPNRIFGAIFSGASPDEIWALSSTGKFPGAHFYLQYPFAPDAWALFAINLGCSVGLWGLLPAVGYQFFKEKNYFDAIGGILLALLILFSMTGVLGLKG